MRARSSSDAFLHTFLKALFRTACWDLVPAVAFRRLNKKIVEDMGHSGSETASEVRKRKECKWHHHLKHFELCGTRA
jgi:hypothetical protein